MHMAPVIYTQCYTAVLCAKLLDKSQTGDTDDYERFELKRHRYVCFILKPFSGVHQRPPDWNRMPLGIRTSFVSYLLDTAAIFHMSDSL